MPLKTLESASLLSKALDSKSRLLKTSPHAEANENPSIGGHVATTKVWRLPEGKPAVSSTSTKRPAGKPKRVPAEPNTKLLVFDEESTQMKILCEALEPQSTVPRASHVPLRHWPNKHTSLVLTDLKVAERDGIEFLRATREIDPDLVGIVMAEQTVCNAAGRWRGALADLV
jgi:hypothetical protein